MTALLLNTAQLGFFGPFKAPPPPPPPPPPSYILFEDYSFATVVLPLCTFAALLIISGDLQKLFRFLFSKKSSFKPANTKMPPGRVRHMFKKLDKDGSGGLTMEELLVGFAKEFNVTSLAPHVKAKMQEAFDRVASDDKQDGKSLKASHFGRFYAEVLFRHFDADNSGTLELAEVQKAMAFLTKPGQPTPVVAYPPQYTQPSGEVHLPIGWFWSMFSAMD